MGLSVVSIAIAAVVGVSILVMYREISRELATRGAPRSVRVLAVGIVLGWIVAAVGWVLGILEPLVLVIISVIWGLFALGGHTLTNRQALFSDQRGALVASYERIIQRVGRLNPGTDDVSGILHDIAGLDSFRDTDTGPWIDLVQAEFGAWAAGEPDTQTRIDRRKRILRLGDELFLESRERR